MAAFEPEGAAGKGDNSYRRASRSHRSNDRLDVARDWATVLWQHPGTLSFSPFG